MINGRAIKLVIRLCLILASSAGIGSGVASAQGLQFEDYPARAYSGPARAPNLASHPEARTYATRLRNLAKGQANFAGEYVLGVWGCGAQCLMGAAINARTGHVIFLPGTICCWAEGGANVNPIDYHADSKLIVLKGLVNESEPLATHYYQLQGSRFQFIQRTAGVSGNPDPDVRNAPPVQDVALVCYFDSQGAQRDADSCKIGGDLSASGVTQLKARCLQSSGATCTIGESGPCRPGSGKYSQYQVFDREQTQGCPILFSQVRNNNNNRYDARAAQFVTSSRDPAVIDYIICLADAAGSAPRNLGVADRLAAAERVCQRSARSLPNSVNEPSAEDIRLSILECGFRPGEASPDADCTKTATNDTNENGPATPDPVAPDPSQPISPAFDCTMANSPAERTICANNQLASLDKALSAEYEMAISNITSPAVGGSVADVLAFKREQRAWLRKRDACRDNEDCLFAAYQSRLRQVEQLNKPE